MRNTKHIDLLVNISRLYYEHGYSQQMIAKKTGFSRPYVSKLINQAKEYGIVEIRINDPNSSETRLEREVREKFGLDRVILIPYNNDLDENLLDRLGAETSRYISTIIRDNDILGVSWGRTLFTCSRNLQPIEEVKNITVVQLCGAVSIVERKIFASEIPKNFAVAYKGTSYILPLPAVVNDLNVKNAIVKDKNIRSILDMGKRTNIAIFSVGAFDHNSTLPRAGYISPQDVDTLIRKGAVGDVCSRIININGEICDGELDQRTIGIELDDLRNKKHSILVAGGKDKIKSMYAVLAGKYPNTLISDEDTAMKLLNMN